MRSQVLAIVAIVCGTTALPAQATAIDPWTKVPAAPTTYFRDLDFSQRLHSLAIELQDLRRQQEEINTSIQMEYQKLGPMEIVNRMNAFMMKDPQRAMKMMEAQQATASQVTGTVTSRDAVKKERETELEELGAAYKAEMEAAAKPYQAKRDEIRKTGAVSVLAGADWAFKTKADETAYNEQVGKQNADISARSVAWFGPSGKFTAWLAKYRSTVIDPMARGDEAIDGIAASQFAIMETPAAAYRSTAQMKAAQEYLEVMRKVYDLRIDMEHDVHKIAK
jgi:hypothetical protein